MCKYTEKTLEMPTDDIIINCIQAFNQYEKYNEDNVRLAFSHFDNSCIENVFAKVVVLNNLYSAGLYNKQVENQKDKVDVRTMSEYLYVHRAFFDSERTDDVIVSWIENTLHEFGIRYNYKPFSFITKYCAWSFPKQNIPIVDSYTKAMLYYINELHPYFGRKFYRYEINNEKDGVDVKYSFFCEVFAKFKEEYANEFSYKEIDKYLWYYGKHGKEGVNKPIQF